METVEPNYVADQARNWAQTDLLVRWVNQAEDGPMPLAELISEYLGQNNPFPDDMRVEVQRRDADGWEPAVIVERTDVDEWTVEYDNGEQAWRDHHELRAMDDQNDNAGKDD